MVLEPENLNAQCFDDLCATSGLWHTGITAADGSPLRTWRSPHGFPTCLDYFGVPESWQSGLSRLRTVDFLDLHAEIDHWPLVVDVEVSALPPPPRAKTPDTELMLTTEGRSVIHNIMQQVPPIPWAMDANDHLACLNSYFQRAIKQHFGVARSRPRCPYLTQDTWLLLAHRRHLRRTHRRRATLHLREVLHATFRAWAAAPRGSAADDFGARFAALRLRNDCWAFLHMRRMRGTSKKIRASFRTDAANFARENMRAARGAGPAELARLLRSVLKSGRAYKPPRVAVVLQGAEGEIWDEEEVAAKFSEHFGKAEQATPKQLAELANDSLVVVPDQPVPVEALPSLAHITRAFAGLKPRRASGISRISPAFYSSDPLGAALAHLPLLLKASLRGTVPCLWKGSVARPLAKPGKNPRSTTGYRSIALQEPAAKALQKAFRPEIARGFEAHTLASTGGARKGIPLTLPALTIQSHIQLAARRGVSASVIFLDGISAFYSVERLPLFSADRGALERALWALPVEQLVVQTFLQHLPPQGVLSALGVSRPSQHVLQQFLTDTWFTTFPTSPVVQSTQVGTVPGAPLADLLFQAIALAALQTIEELMRSERLAAAIHIGHNHVTAEPTTWLDDLALLVESSRPAELGAATARAASLAQQCLLLIGVRTNFEPGKTEALLVHRGRGSRAAKHAVFIEGGVFCIKSSSVSLALTGLHRLTSAHFKQKQYQKEQKSEALPTGKEDSHHAPASPHHDYITWRLSPLLKFYPDRIPVYMWRRGSGCALFMIATVLAAVLCAADLTNWRAIVLSISSALGSWQEFTCVDKKLQREGTVLATLHNLMLWCQPLPDVDKEFGRLKLNCHKTPVKECRYLKPKCHKRPLKEFGRLMLKHRKTPPKELPAETLDAVPASVDDFRGWLKTWMARHGFPKAYLSKVQVADSTGNAFASCRCKDQAKLRHAERVKHLVPLRALAQLLSEGVPNEEMPDEAQLAKAHRRCITAKGSKRKIDATSGDLPAWLEFLEMQFSLREAKSGHELKYWAAELREDDSFLPLSALVQLAQADEKVTPGTAVMRSDKMMDMAALVLRTCPPVLLCDVTYKISSSGWGLALFALASQHLDAHTAWPASQAVVLGAAWVPKENYTSWLAALATVYRIYLPLRLHEKVRVVMFDGTTGGEKAVKFLLPDVLLARDVRHVQANVKKHSASSSSTPLAVRDYLASQVLFSAALPTQTLFTILWDEVLNSLCGRPDMQAYLSQHVLQRHATKDVWEAPWWAGFGSGLKGGFTTLTSFQALERMNQTLKSSLPSNFHLLSIQDVSERIERLYSTWCRPRKGFQAIYRKRRWIDPATGDIQPGQIAPRLEALVYSCAAPRRQSKQDQLTDPDKVVPRFVNGDWLQTERMPWEGKRQWKVPTAARYLEYAPSNYMTKEIQEFGGMRVRSVTLMPFDSPDWHIDPDTFQAMCGLVLAESVEQALTFLAKLGAVRKDGRVSLYHFHSLMTNLCLVFQTGRIYARCGSCPHELFTRWRLGDQRVVVARMAQFVRANAPVDIVHANEVLRQEILVRQLPRRSAWLTLAKIQERLQRLRERRQQKKKEREQQLLKLYEDQDLLGLVKTPDTEGVLRDKALADAKGMLGKNFVKQLQALHSMIFLKTTLKEAKSMKATELVVTLSKSKGPVAEAAKILVNAWKSELAAGDKST
ncbi:unnamed protein product [Symbiodinium sp. CCMP2592]|nr:unnamed protein product [Symbiodinium sp. CCMP2592]